MCGSETDSAQRAVLVMTLRQIADGVGDAQALAKWAVAEIARLAQEANARTARAAAGDPMLQAFQGLDDFQEPERIVRIKGMTPD